MKFTFEDILGEKEWIHSELLNSVPYEVIDKAHEDGFYDVKLLVNGVEIEPIFFNKLMNNVEKYVDDEAKLLVVEKLSKVTEKVEILRNLVGDAVSKIIEEFNLEVSLDEE